MTTDPEKEFAKLKRQFDRLIERHGPVVALHALRDWCIDRSFFPILKGMTAAEIQRQETTNYLAKQLFRVYHGLARVIRRP